MQYETQSPHQRSTAVRWVFTALLLTLAACGHLTDRAKPAAEKKNTRAELNVGYSLLYQEADGIPKLKWIFVFKDKNEEMAQITDSLVSYYQHLADTMERLSKLYPAMRIDSEPMSEIEGKARKAIGEEMAKDFAPLVGKSGVDFEREALLMFYDALNEQRHIAEVMTTVESDPGLKQFLESTKAQLDARHARIGALLHRRYFTH